jgi:hypothetical protein
MQLRHELNELEGAVKRDPARHEAFKRDFAELATGLERINPKAPDAMSQIQDWYFIRLADLKKRLEQRSQGGTNLRRDKD